MLFAWLLIQYVSCLIGQLFNIVNLMLIFTLKIILLSIKKGIESYENGYWN